MADSRSLGDVLRAARQRLTQVTADPAQEVRILGGWAFGLTRLEMVLREKDVAASEGLALFEAALTRRIAGEPVYRIIGSRPFRGLNLALSKDTLDPRPDTEILVDLALSQIAARGDLLRPLSILDLGTGSGAVGLALLAELPQATGVLTDISGGALKTAADNASTNDLANRTAFLESNWFDAVTGRFDVIVSNPPYIPSGMIAGLDIEVRDHDPLRALDGGAGGLEAYRAIAGRAPAFLNPGGFIAVEIGHDQAVSVAAIFAASGFHFVELRQDLGGRDRALAFALQ